MAITSRSAGSAACARIWRTLAVPSPQVVWMWRSALPTEHRLERQPLVWPAADELLEYIGHALDLGPCVRRWDERRPHVGHNPSIVQSHGRTEHHRRLAPGGDGEGIVWERCRPAEEADGLSIARHVAIADDGYDFVPVQRAVDVPHRAAPAHDHIHAPSPSPPDHQVPPLLRAKLLPQH